jgi:hypothetical protein
MLLPTSKHWKTEPYFVVCFFSLKMEPICEANDHDVQVIEEHKFGDWHGCFDVYLCVWL